MAGGGLPRVGAVSGATRPCRSAPSWRAVRVIRRVRASAAVATSRALRRVRADVARASFAADHALARSSSAVLARFGTAPTSDALVFVHWSHDGRPLPWETRGLAAARADGLGVCVVLNLDRADGDLQESWAGCTDLTVERRNRGRDLAAYRDGVREILQGGQRGSIVLANDSVLWRDDAHALLAGRARNVGAQVVAATSSREIRPHLQTPWLWFDASIEPATLLRLVSLWRNVRDRSTVIQYGELPLADAARALGLTTGSIFPDDVILGEMRRLVEAGEDVPARTAARRARVLRSTGAGVALNPTHHMWRELLELGYPGVKRDLLARNAGVVEDSDEIPACAARYGFLAADFATPIRADASHGAVRSTSGR